MVVKVHTSWAEFREYFRQQVIPRLADDIMTLFYLRLIFDPLINLSQDGEKRLLAFTKRGTQIHSVSSELGTCSGSLKVLFIS